VRGWPSSKMWRVTRHPSSAALRTSSVKSGVPRTDDVDARRRRRDTRVRSPSPRDATCARARREERCATPQTATFAHDGDERDVVVDENPWCAHALTLSRDGDRRDARLAMHATVPAARVRSTGGARATTYHGVRHRSGCPRARCAKVACGPPSIDPGAEKVRGIDVRAARVPPRLEGVAPGSRRTWLALRTNRAQPTSRPRAKTGGRAATSRDRRYGWGMIPELTGHASLGHSLPSISADSSERPGNVIRAQQPSTPPPDAEQPRAWRCGHADVRVGSWRARPRPSVERARGTRAGRATRRRAAPRDAFGRCRARIAAHDGPGAACAERDDEKRSANHLAAAAQRAVEAAWRCARRAPASHARARGRPPRTSVTRCTWSLWTEYSVMRAPSRWLAFLERAEHDPETTQRAQVREVGGGSSS